MKAAKLIILSLALAGSVTGCVPSRTMTDSTVFFVEAYLPEGSIAVLSLEDEAGGSLEFAAYKKKFEAKLQAVGYTIAGDPGQADYVALVSYGIDDEDSKTVCKAKQSGSVYSYGGTGYVIPAYGVVGGSTDCVTHYHRVISLDIVEAGSFREGKPDKVYEGRTRSTGKCSIIVEVFDEMLEAMFNDFPGINGRNRKQAIPSEINC